MKVLSGIQTSGSGELHIGNYLGAVRQWIELQENNEVYYMLANLHAVTVPLGPSAAKENVSKMAALLLALGVDPQKSTLFVQSLVPAHAELAWLLNTLAYMGELRRMTQFKDKAGIEHDSVSVGLFDYPVLMAADILLYQAESVPVGDDQKQHLELARQLAQRFNQRFGRIFTVPEPFIPADAARIMGLDNPTKKMSKSFGPNNYLGLLDDMPTIRGKMKKAVTDSANEVRFDPAAKPAITNLLTIFSALTKRSIKDLEKDYGSTGYGRFKTDLGEAVIAFLAPIQERYQSIMADQVKLEQLLRQGSAKAQLTAGLTLKKSKERMGIWT